MQKDACFHINRREAKFLEEKEECQVKTVNEINQLAVQYLKDASIASLQPSVLKADILEKLRI